MDHGTKVAKELATSYGVKCNCERMTSSSRDSTIELGLRLGKSLYNIIVLAHYTIQAQLFF